MTIIKNYLRDSPTHKGWRLLPVVCEHDPDDSLLLDVDFKWLMAGHGWWVDTTRLHQDPSYAAQCLESAMASASFALHGCAGRLQTQLDWPIANQRT